MYKQSHRRNDVWFHVHAVKLSIRWRRLTWWILGNFRTWDQKHIIHLKRTFYMFSSKHNSLKRTIGSYVIIYYRKFQKQLPLGLRLSVTKTSVRQIRKFQIRIQGQILQHLGLRGRSAFYVAHKARDPTRGECNNIINKLVSPRQEFPMGITRSRKCKFFWNIKIPLSPDATNQVPFNEDAAKQKAVLQCVCVSLTESSV